MLNHPNKRFVFARIHWLISNPTNVSTTGITAYRASIGIEDLFSVFVKFSAPSAASGHWQLAKIYALVESMEPRLPDIGSILILTAGLTPVAEAEIFEQVEE